MNKTHDEQINHRILELYVNGWHTKRIANHLNITDYSIWHRMYKMRRKHNCENNIQLAFQLLNGSNGHDTEKS